MTEKTTFRFNINIINYSTVALKGHPVYLKKIIRRSFNRRFDTSKRILTIKIFYGVMLWSFRNFPMTVLI